jgi:anti-anti-sigma factor
MADFRERALVEILGSVGAMAAEFAISLDLPDDGAHVVRLAGDLDVAAADEVDRFLAHLRGDVCLDCAELRFVDPAGLRCLLAASARLNRLFLVNVAAPVRRIFEVTATTSLLDPRSVTVAERSSTQGGV